MNLHRIANADSNQSASKVVGFDFASVRLEALAEFFQAMPSQCELAYVIGEHQSPQVQNAITHTLQQLTSMTVRHVKRETTLQPGAVYLIPPTKAISVSGGKLLLSDSIDTLSIHLPPDSISHRVSEPIQEQSISMVLLNVATANSEEVAPSELAAHLKDLSRWKEAERVLRGELQRRDEFLAILSHELRNPLGAVLNAARVIRRSLDQPESLEASVNIIEKQLAQTSRLLDDLLDMSRIAKNKIVLRQEPIDLREIASHALETVREQFEQREHEVKLVTPGRAVKVHGDSARLLQITENLLSNAAKYTPATGKIRLKVEQANDQAILRVIDNGRGLTQGMLSSIFEPFSQSSHPDDLGNGGMGVGLSLVKSLVDMHGGKVEATSKGKNMGSEFTVQLPLTKQKLKKHKPAEPTQSTKGLKITLVEDNPASRQSLTMLLNLEGFEVSGAANAASGMEVISHSLPNVAILDIGLPDKTGYELAIELREQLQEETPYLIALTGYGRDSDRKAVFEAGFDAHLVKPLDIDQLLETLSQLPAALKQG